MTIDQFGKALIASGLMTAEDVKAFWAAIPAEARPKDGAAFGKLLVDKGLLTPFQVAEIVAGRGARLMMGDYTIVSQIGAGGMGQVYKAQHRRMKRVVALKVMSNAAMQDEAAVKRFQREVHAAARLEHPNIVTAYDSGEAGSVKYLVMQFVDGGDLSDLVKKSGRLEIAQAVGYAIQAAKGLAFAHGEGVIHRDIKPANLLLDKKGVVKILDMGLARFEDGGDGLTATEQVMGTVDYMSPEQAANTKGCDGRADIYSLGCTLWFLLTGKKLYEADTLIARLMLHRDGPLPSLVKERDDAPWPLEQALHKMIAKRAADRFQTMDEVVAALAPFGGDASQSGSLGGSGTSGGQSAELASFMQAMGTGGTKTSHPSATQMKAATAKPATSVNLEATAQLSTADVGTDPKSQVLPKGTPTAPAQLQPKRKKPGNDKTKLIAAGALGGLLLLAGIIVLIRNKDGDVVAEVKVPEGGKVEVVATPPPVVKPNAQNIPAAPEAIPLAQMLDSPDYVWTTPENLGPNVNSTSDDWKPTLTADELRMVFRGDDGASQNSSSLWECRRTSIDQPFGPRVRLIGSAYEDEPFLSADGLTLLYDSHAVASGRTAEDIRMRRRLNLDAPWGAPETLPLTEDRDEQSPWLSPDGLMLIYSAPGGVNGSRDLWICSRASTDAKFGPTTSYPKGANSPASESCPQLLSDGRTILFSRDGKPHMTFTSTNGVQSALQLLGMTDDVRDAWLSNDGRRLYFNSKRAGGLGGYDIWMMRLMPKGSATPSVPSFVSSVPPSFVNPTNPTTPPPAGDYALRLTGQNTVTAPNPRLDESQPFTVEAYITPGDINPNQLFGRRLFGVDSEFHIEIKDSRWRFYSTHNEAMSPERFTPRRRVHVAGVRTTTGRQLYLDGKLVASNDDPLKLASKESETPLLIEARGAAEFTFDELRISQGIIYDKEFAPPTKLTADANTLALYHFDEGFGDMLRDSSGNHRRGKITGGTWVKADGSPISTVDSPTVPTSAGVVYLDDLPEIEAIVGVSSLGKHGKFVDKDNSVKSVLWRGGPVAHSLFMHPLTGQTSFVRYQIDGGYATFAADVGISESADAYSPAIFRVLGDGRELWKSQPLQNRGEFAAVSVDIRGVKELRLETTCRNSSKGSHATWFMPRLTPAISTPQIPAEALTFGGHRYLLVDCGPPGTPLLWDQARAQAEAMGGHLATINSQAEHDWVRDNILLKRPKTTGHHVRMFLGASTAADSIEWKWVTGERLDRSLWTNNFPGAQPRDLVLVWVHNYKPETWLGGKRADFQGGYYLLEWDTLGAPVSQAGPPAADHALQFDGQTAHVVTPITHRTNTPLTIEVTLRPGPVRSAIISNSEGSGFGLDIVNGAPNFLAFRRSSGTESYARATAPQALDMSRSHRLAAVFDGAKIRLFVDGKLAATSDLAGEYLPSDLPLIIGASPEGQGIDYPFTGTLDEVRISKTARYTTDYNPVDRLPSDPDTLAMYHFDDGSGDVLKDSSGNSRHGKIVGAKWVKLATSAAPTGASPTAPTTVAPAVARPRWPLTPTKPEELAWLKSLGARLTLRNGDSSDRVVNKNLPLPDGNWTVVGIELDRENGQVIDDAAMRRISELVDLETFRCDFDIKGTSVTEQGLSALKSLVNLRNLQLGRLTKTGGDPALLVSFPQLESLALMNSPLVGWEPHAAKLPNLRELTLYNSNEANLKQLGAMPRLTKLRFAGYQNHHPIRLAAVQPFIAANPWCRIQFVGLDGDNMKELVVEPTAPPPGTSPVAVTAEDPAVVAKWLLDNKKLRGIRVEIDGRQQHVPTVPTGPFKVIELNFSRSNNSGQPLTEEEVARLAVCTDLESLELSTLTDAGLAKLAPLKKLKSLVVPGTELTPAAVATIRQFPQLEHLHAFGDDEWLKALAGMPTLRSMIFWKVSVSPQAMSLFSQYPNLKELLFHECVAADNGPNTAISIAPLKDCKNLSKLTLAGKNVGAAELALLSGFTQLLELYLNTPSITEAQVKQLAAALPRCKIIWTDAANKNHTFEPTAPPNQPAATTTNVDNPATFAKWLLDNKKLARIGFEVGGRVQNMSTVPTGPYKVVELNFSKNNNAGQQLTEEELGRLAVFTDLETLDVGDQPLTDAGLVRLTTLKKLRKLTVPNTALTPAAVTTIRQFPQLETLHSFSTDEWLKPLAGMPSIKSLAVHRSEISAEAMGWFPQYPNLNELVLQDCFTTVGAELNVALAPLKDCKNLSKLRLSTGLVDAGTIVVLSGLTQLHELDLGTTQFTEAQVKQLAAALPRCQVKWQDSANNFKQHIFEPTARP